MGRKTEEEEFVVVSKVRAGHKREFDFAVKSQNENGGCLGRTRSCRRRPLKKRNDDDDDDDDDGEWTSMEKIKKKKEKERRESGGKRGKGMVYELLRTGFMEGVEVRYCRSFRRRVQRKSSDLDSLRGVVKGDGIQCFCRVCKGRPDKVVSPTIFEIHAGSRNKRPADFIYLDNGKTFRDVLNACLHCKSEDLEATIKVVCGIEADHNSSYGSVSAAGNESTNYVPCDDDDDDDEDDDGFAESEASEGTPEGASETSEETMEIATEPSEISEETPDGEWDSSEETLQTSSQTSYISSEQVLDESSDVHSGLRLTCRHAHRHKIVFKDDAVFPDGTEVFYYFREKIWMSGTKEGTGIICMCCQKKMSPSQFEAHAGWALHRQPYKHIYTSKGVSLYSLVRTSSIDHNTSVGKSDELCNVCQRGGNFIFCGGCPRVFHKECVHLRGVQNEKYYCRCCRYEKFQVVATNQSTIEAAGVGDEDPEERRCMRLVEAGASDRGGCVLCRAQDFLKEGFGPRTLMLCDQCEREYHVGCLREEGMQDLKELPQGNWFCCSGCDRINSTLQQLIEEGEQEILDSLLNVIKGNHATRDYEDVEHDIKWRLLSGNMSGVDGVEQLFSDAISVFHEQFSEIVLPGSKKDLIPFMVFGKNMKKFKDYRGMYCAVLTVNSQVVSAGVLRVFGTEIAELPLVATTKCCERLGYFQTLYFCIENLLREMEVNHLCLPAANEAKPMWTNKLGFSTFPNDELAEVGKWYQLTPFHGTSMLRKAVPNKIEDAAATIVVPDRLEWLPLDGGTDGEFRAFYDWGR